MTPHERAAPRGGWASLPRLDLVGPLAAGAGFLGKALAIARLEALRLRHDPTELAMRAVQPALWLLVFGQVFARARAIPTGDLPYLDFIAPGILAQSVLFIAIFYGISPVAAPLSRVTSGAAFFVITISTPPPCCGQGPGRETRWCSHSTPARNTSTRRCAG
jgi:hypothetical protein